MRFTISKQISATCVLIIAIFMVMNSYMYYRITVVERTYQTLLEDSTQFTSAAKDIRAQLWLRNTHIRNYILTGDAKDLERSNEVKKTTGTQVSELESKMNFPKAAREIGVLKLALNEYNKTLDQGAEVRKKLGIEGTLKFLAASGKRAEGMEIIIDSFTGFVSQEIRAQIEETKAEQSRAMLIVILCNIGILVIAMAAAVMLARKISRPVAAMAATAESVAGGNLRSREIAYHFNDEIGDMSNSIQKMVNGLRGMVNQVTATANQVASASNQLNLVSEQSAEAAEEVAKTTTQLASGAAVQTNEMNKVVDEVSDIVSNINHVADSAASLSLRATKTAEVAIDGKSAVTKVSNQMQVINNSVNQSSQGVKDLGESSQQIGNIVLVISNIASQTNMLALNAAIEAARAGEHGRGFSVVASEVKKLADQSQEAAQSIANIIKAIQVKIEDVVTMMEKGSRDVQQGTEDMISTLEQFNHIANLIQKLEQQISEITMATTNVSSSGDKVLGSIGSVKKMVEETVSGTHTISAATEEQLASMEEISSSSSILAKKAKELETLMAQFKI
ncbi:MAG: methyl-accepting chemotaxis sensory transducer [Firmicutes bacterium]|nr:methyl-accepting chemotaxis sensory transducer [Bacillota bacterium]